MADNVVIQDVSDLPIAKEDLIVHDEQLGIDRKVFAGQPVPADLVDAYEKATGTGKKDDDSSSKSSASSKSAAK